MIINHDNHCVRRACAKFILKVINCLQIKEKSVAKRQVRTGVVAEGGGCWGRQSSGNNSSQKSGLFESG